MAIKITYQRLVESDAALAALGAVKFTSGQDKMLIAKTRRLLSQDRGDIERQREELVQKYCKVTQDRLIAAAKAKAELIEDPAAKQSALDEADKIPVPQQVTMPELQDFVAEYTKLLQAEVTVPVSKILASKVLNDEGFTADHAFTLDWLLEDDVSPQEEAAAQDASAAVSETAEA